jgi:hypothetical protein
MFRMAFRFLAVVLLVAQMLPAQQQQQVQQQQVANREKAGAPAESKAESKTPPKLSKEDRQLASQLLEVSESEARGFEAPMRAFSLLQISQVYAAMEPAKARTILKDAFTASLGIQDDDRTKSRLQDDIFQTLLPLSQADVEERLPQAQADSRKRASEAIIASFIEKKQYGPAIDLITEMTRLDEFPYSSGTKLMTAMPAEMTGEKMSLFSQALNSYKNHEHTNMNSRDSSLTGLVVRFGDKLPPRLVLQAIDEILTQAKKISDPFSITISGEGGTASFSSPYEYELFSLLPLLRQLDESRVKSLLEDNQDLRNKMAQYANGLQSIDPSIGDPKAKNGGMSTSIHSSKGSGAGQGAGNPGGVVANNNVEQYQEAMRNAERIIRDSPNDPTQAIAQAAALPVKMLQGGVSPRGAALEGIARENAKESPAAAKRALDELRKIITDLPLKLQVQFLSSAANGYLQMGEQESVEKLVAEGFKIADKLLEKDLDPDNPNQALKAWWPSVDAYRRFIEIQTKISQRSAVKILTDIKDPEIRAYESIMVSRAMLGLPVKRFMIMEKTKNSNLVSMHSED